MIIITVVVTVIAVVVIILTVVVIVIAVVVIVIAVVVIIITVVVSGLDRFDYVSKIIVIYSFGILSDDRPGYIVDYDFDFLTCSRVSFNF